MVEDASFLKPRNAPEITYGLGGTLSIPLGQGELEVFAKYAYIDELETSLLNLDVGRVDSRDDLAASVTYYYNNWRVSVFGRNLTDEQFEVPAIIDPLFASGTINRGATYGVEFEIDLGGG